MRTPPASLDSLFARALDQLRRHARLAASAPALAGALLGLEMGQTGCTTEYDVDHTAQADWAQFEGQRDTRMVSYLGQFWSQCTQPNTRFGCSMYEIYVKVRLRPVPGGDLGAKHAGVVFRVPGDPTERTAVGHYFTTLPGGDEEWHVPVSLPSFQRTMVFDVWYQDGAGHTYYDDNMGERHIINDGPEFNLVRLEPWQSLVTVDATGVKGQLSVQLADLDFDKEVLLVGTTDDWQTVLELGIGQAGDANRWYWVEDYGWSERERWMIDLDLPGQDIARFQYAVAYRHGVVGGAKVYEFWDNNGGSNYVIQRATTP